MLGDWGFESSIDMCEGDFERVRQGCGMGWGGQRERPGLRVEAGLRVPDGNWGG